MVRLIPRFKCKVNENDDATLGTAFKLRMMV